MGAALKAIRAGIKARLLDNTAAGARVSTNRADKVWQESLPAIVIYTRSETVELDDAAPPSYKRTAEVVIDLLLEDSSGLPLDDDADDLAEVVEQLMFMDPTLRAECGELVNSAYQSGYEIVVQDGGANLIAGVRVSWKFIYYQDTVPLKPGELAPWKRANTAWALDPTSP